MADEPTKPAHISQEDWDAAAIPEITEEEHARARPFAEVFPAQFKAWKNKGGRPKSPSPKVMLHLRVAAELADAIKANGKGYNGRAEAILQQAHDEGRI